MFQQHIDNKSHQGFEGHERNNFIYLMLFPKTIKSKNYQD